MRPVAQNAHASAHPNDNSLPKALVHGVLFHGVGEPMANLSASPLALSPIPYNSIGDDAFTRSSELEAFRAVLRARKVGTIVRYSGGGDVGAACGQLAGA